LPSPNCNRNTDSDAMLLTIAMRHVDKKFAIMSSPNT
jgi:hypothetical protein